MEEKTKCKRCGTKNYLTGPGTYLPQNSDLCSRCFFWGKDYGHSFEGLSIRFSRGLLTVYVEVRLHEWDDTEKCHHWRNTFCEYGSPMAEKAMPKNHYGHEIYGKMALLVARYQKFLLGEEGIKAYMETAKDRKLAEILSHGGTMDMKTGIIVDPTTGEEI